MALRALGGCVLACQRPVSVQGVIELRVGPINCAVASTAIARQAKCYVRRILAVVEVRRVAGVALGGSGCEVIVDMARGAYQSRVSTCERVPGVLQVVELRAHEVVHGVAGLARGGEVQSHVVDDRRQEVFLMARVAGGR